MQSYSFFNLKSRKLIPALALCSLAIATLNQYQNYQALCRAVSFRTIVREPWIVEEVLSGSSFTVRRGNKTKAIAQFIYKNLIAPMNASD